MAKCIPKTLTLSLLLLHLAFLVVGQGTQFITGPCTSDADCASGCCGFNTGKCAGPVFAQEVDGGCGFGNAQPNSNAALSLLGSATAAPVAQTATESATSTIAAVQASTTSSSASTGAGTQFITGPCTSDADCASGCCGFNTGKCAGPVFAQEVDGGCGFGNAQPNSNAALSLLGSATAAPVAQTATQPTITAAAPQASTTSTSVSKGTQFITGPCTSDADCADGCCGFNTGKCAGPVVAQEVDGGCGFGDAQPNDNAARALGASKRGIPYTA